MITSTTTRTAQFCWTVLLILCVSVGLVPLTASATATKRFPTALEKRRKLQQDKNPELDLVDVFGNSVNDGKLYPNPGDDGTALENPRAKTFGDQSERLHEGGPEGESYYDQLGNEKEFVGE